MSEFSSAQEAFWAGSFGDDYIARNDSPALIANKTAVFARALQRTHGIRSVLELGANVGLNIVALKTLLPAAEFHAVEINSAAFSRLRKIDGLNATEGSLFDYRIAEPVDLAFTQGVLIHLAPERVPDAYAKLYETSRRYVLITEYYNPSLVEVRYRGHEARLFKRDWAGEMMDAYPDLSLLDYGFVYHRDPSFPADDFTWFLMEKRA